MGDDTDADGTVTCDRCNSTYTTVEWELNGGCAECYYISTKMNY